jgi:hypothetical protein
MTSTGFDLEFENYGGKRTASFDVAADGTIVVDVDGEYSFEIPPAVATGLAMLVLARNRTPGSAPQTGHSGAQTSPHPGRPRTG